MSATHKTPGRFFNAWAIFGLALAVRWAVVYLYYFVYKTPGGIAPSPASGEVYEILALQLLGGRGFASSMFAYRPPLEPMLIALVYGLTGGAHPLLAVLAQTVISSAVCLAAYRIALDMALGETSARIAALIIALDPASLANSVTFAAETVSNLFLALSLLFLVRLVTSQKLLDAAACGAATALAALARPNAIYFSVVAAAIVVLLAQRRWIKVGLYLCAFAAGVLPWYVRNYAYNNLFTFATTGSFNLLFYTGVAVESAATGRAPTEVQAELAYELDRRLGDAEPPETYDYQAIWHHLVPSNPNADRVMRDMALEIYSRRPLTYVVVMLKQLVKLLAFSDLYESFGVAKWLELGANILLYIFAARGVIYFYREKLWLPFWVTVLPSGYFLAVPMIAGGVQDTRARTNITVTLAIMAAAAIQALFVSKAVGRR